MLAPEVVLEELVPCVVDTFVELVTTDVLEELVPGVEELLEELTPLLVFVEVDA